MSDIECVVDADCVPLPACRAQTCINKIFIETYRERSPDKENSLPHYNVACTAMYYGHHIEERTVIEGAGCQCQSSKCYNSRQHISFWRLSNYLPFGKIILLIPFFIFSTVLCHVNIGQWKMGRHLAIFISIFVMYFVLALIS